MSNKAISVYAEALKRSEQEAKATQSPVEKKVEVSTKQPANRDTKQPRNQSTVVPRHHDTMIELVRKAVKDFGKEAATHRFTLEEKRAIADIIYSYERRGLRTSENEVTRVAINFILGDYKQNGENSILHRVLAALNE